MSLMSEHQGKIRVFFGIFGASVAAGCGLCPVVSFFDLVSGEFEPALVAPAAVGLVFVAMGLFLVFLAFRGWDVDGDDETSTSREPQTSERERRQRRTLELAESMGGQLTVSELSMEMPYTIEEAEAHLDAFVEQGVARLDISAESGQKRYTFPALQDGAGPSDQLEEELAFVMEDLESEASDVDDTDDSRAPRNQRDPQADGTREMYDVAPDEGGNTS